MPLPAGYKPELGVTGELKAEGIQFYQEIIGQLQCAVEISRVDILLETSILLTHLAMPREWHLEVALHVVGYLKSHKKMCLLFNSSYPRMSEKWFKKYNWFNFYRDTKEAILPNMPEVCGRYVIITCFVDANHARNVQNRRSQTGILIFVNRAPIHLYSKRQSTMEASTFGAEFCAMKTAIKMIEGLRYKLRMFSVPIKGPANVMCNNEAVTKNTTILESTFKKKHHLIAYHICREAVAAQTVQIAKQGTKKNLSDLVTKQLTQQRREFLLKRLAY